MPGSAARGQRRLVERFAGQRVDESDPLSGSLGFKQVGIEGGFDDCEQLIFLELSDLPPESERYVLPDDRGNRERTADGFTKAIQPDIDDLDEQAWQHNTIERREVGTVLLD